MVAEPLAVLKAVAASVVPGRDTNVLIHTDHMGLVFAGARGYGKCYMYNQMLTCLAEHFPGVRFSFVFVRGCDNPADTLSRGWVEDGWWSGSAKMLGACSAGSAPVLPRLAFPVVSVG